MLHHLLLVNNKLFHHHHLSEGSKLHLLNNMENNKLPLHHRLVSNNLHLSNHMENNRLRLNNNNKLLLLHNINRFLHLHLVNRHPLCIVNKISHKKLAVFSIIYSANHKRRLNQHQPKLLSQYRRRVVFLIKWLIKVKSLVKK